VGNSGVPDWPQLRLKERAKTDQRGKARGRGKRSKTDCKRKTRGGKAEEEIRRKRCRQSRAVE